MILWRPTTSYPGDWITRQRGTVLHQAPTKGGGMARLSSTETMLKGKTINVH